MLTIGKGYDPWTWEDIEKFALQARADLWWAAALALYSGQRQADVLGMLWSTFRKAYRRNAEQDRQEALESDA